MLPPEKFMSSAEVGGLRTGQVMAVRRCLSPRASLVAAAFVLSLLTVRTAAAETVNHERFFWYMGYLLGLRTQLDVCAERFPEFNDKNQAAWASSVYWNPERDKVLAADPSTVDDKDVADLIRALPKVREQVASTDASKLRDLCERLPERVETVTKQAFNEGTIQIRARLASETASGAAGEPAKARKSDDHHE